MKETGIRAEEEEQAIGDNKLLYVGVSIQGASSDWHEVLTGVI